MEFRNVYGIEHSENGKLRTQVFYCDPYCSWQKGSVEKNHEFIRQVLPKKTSFDWLTQDAVDLMMSHINSYPRARLNDKSPFEVAEFFVGKTPAYQAEFAKDSGKGCYSASNTAESVQNCKFAAGTYPPITEY